METSQRSLLEARRPAHRSVHLSDVSPTCMVRSNQLTVLHSRTHTTIVLIRTIQGFIGQGNQASSLLNVYAPLCPLYTTAVLIFFLHSATIFIYATNVGSTRLQTCNPLTDTEHRTLSVTIF